MRGVKCIGCTRGPGVVSNADDVLEKNMVREVVVVVVVCLPRPMEGIG